MDMRQAIHKWLSDGKAITTVLLSDCDPGKPSGGENLMISIKPQTGESLVLATDEHGKHLKPLFGHPGKERE